MSQDLEMQSFIDRHVAAVKSLSAECSIAWWNNSITGSDEDAARAEELTKLLVKRYANPDEFAILKSFDPSGFSDPLVARQHSILYRSFLSEQMDPTIIDKLVALETEVNQEYNNYRGEVRGELKTENEVQKILRTSDDCELRKEAWEASKRIGPRVADRVLQMIRIRNEVARTQGFDNYYSKAMILDELDEERVFQQFDELIELTNPLWNEWKSGFDSRQAIKLGIKVEELRPWHHTDLFFQEAPAGTLNLDKYFEGKDLEVITSKFYTAIGLPIESVLARSDLYEKPGKYQHAFCTDIDHEGDVRVLCNNTANERWMGTMLHEFGHAVYDLYSNYDLPWMLRGPSHTLATESIAELMGRFNKDKTWLKLYADVPDSEAEEVGKEAWESQRIQFLLSTRWIVTMCKFEQAMYRDPDQDLNKLWWDVVEKYQSIRRPDNRDQPDWAAKLHLALSPVYYQNYLLGEMMAAQLLHYIRKDELVTGTDEELFTSPAVGEWLKEHIFYPGQVRQWEDGLEFATGERLNPMYFTQQLKSAN